MYRWPVARQRPRNIQLSGSDIQILLVAKPLLINDNCTFSLISNSFATRMFRRQQVHWNRVFSTQSVQICYKRGQLVYLDIMTDPTSRQRGHTTKTRQQISENNLRTHSNIWSQVPEWARYLDIMTDWPSVVMWLWLTRNSDHSGGLNLAAVRFTTVQVSRLPLWPELQVSSRV
jgi:hypothetical protein